MNLRHIVSQPTASITVHIVFKCNVLSHWLIELRKFTAVTISYWAIFLFLSAVCKVIVTAGCHGNRVLDLAWGCLIFLVFIFVKHEQI